MTSRPPRHAATRIAGGFSADSTPAACQRVLNVLAAAEEEEMITGEQVKAARKAGRRRPSRPRRVSNSTVGNFEKGRRISVGELRDAPSPRRGRWRQV